jgi:5'-nucleotidase
MIKRLLISISLVAVVAFPAGAQTIRVLVTNDDGIGAAGIDALVNELALNPNLDLHIYAPATNQSGVSDSFSTTPFAVAAGTTASNVAGTAISGTPADSAMYGILFGMSPPPDLVVSGINAGQNIGRFVAEDGSGTVGAALAAARLGIPAIAVSLGLGSNDWAKPARYVANIVEDFRHSKRLGKKLTSKTGLDQRLLLNINFPACGSGSVRGVVLVPLAHSQDLVGRSVVGYTMTGPGTFQAQLSTTNAFASNCNSTLTEPKDDIEAMNNGFATVTPLNPSLTPDSKLKKFKFLTKFPFN